VDVAMQAALIALTLETKPSPDAVNDKAHASVVLAAPAAVSTPHRTPTPDRACAKAGRSAPCLSPQMATRFEQRKPKDTSAKDKDMPPMTVAGSIPRVGHGRRSMSQSLNTATQTPTHVALAQHEYNSACVRSSHHLLVDTAIPDTRGEIPNSLIPYSNKLLAFFRFRRSLYCADAKVDLYK
jgi:hypothetical protein